MIVALSIDAFGVFDEFTGKTDEVCQTMKSSPTLPGFEEVRLPGEHSYKEKNIRLKTGVPIDSTLLKTLDDLANNLSIVPVGER